MGNRPGFGANAGRDGTFARLQRLSEMLGSTNLSDSEINGNACGVVCSDMWDGRGHEIQSAGGKKARDLGAARPISREMVFP